MWVRYRHPWHHGLQTGADEVVGYDIDEWSVTNSQHNAELNHVENIQILEGDAKVIIHICGLFDVVLAISTGISCYTTFRHGKRCSTLTAYLS
jgi:hypothetical protein